MLSIYMISIFLLMDLLYINSYSVYSQDSKDTSKTGDVDIGLTLSQSHAEKKLDSSKSDFGILAYPFVFYSPETQLAFGAGGMVYFNTSSKRKVKLSKITMSAYYTTNKQYNFSADPRIYFPGINQFYLDASLDYSYTSTVYYGLGNNTPDIDSSNYLTKIFEIEAQLTNLAIFKKVESGFVYEYSSDKMVDKQSNPNLSDPSVNGIDGGNIGGLGIAVLADYRDNTSYPSSGFYTKFTALFFRKPFGSDFSYNRYILDLRKYFMPLKTNIIAVQFFSQFSSANVPFFDMPTIGGSYQMRGYLQGRYVDKQYITAQAEYRKILFWRIGVAAFYALGEVAGNFSSFKLNLVKHSYGFGLRFVFDKQQKINLRADIGIAEGNKGIYFNLEEAF